MVDEFEKSFQEEKGIVVCRARPPGRRVFRNLTKFKNDLCFSKNFKKHCFDICMRFLIIPPKLSEVFELIHGRRVREELPGGEGRRRVQGTPAGPSRVPTGSAMLSTSQVVELRFSCGKSTASPSDALLESQTPQQPTYGTEARFFIARVFNMLLKC